MSKRITPAQIGAAAKRRGLEPATVHAVLAVESNGQGHAADGRPIIRWEAHWFQRLTNGRFNKSHPHLSHSYGMRWNYSQPALQAWRWRDRMDPALTLDRNAAIQSASWGLGQMMGFNYRKCGFASPQEFLNAHWRDEAGQLEAMLNFIDAAGLTDELRRRDWAGFAHGYNGPDFASNKYDAKLAKAYRAALA